MAKYDSQLSEVKTNLTSVKKILIALPSSSSLDCLAAGLALFLSLKQSGKETSIVSSDSIKVSSSNLYGVGEIESQVPKSVGGDLTISLEGVVAADGTVPALEKLDWFPQGQNLNLVFHVLPGQKFEPTKITPLSTSESGFDYIFTIGASSLESLGTIFSSSQQLLSSKVINVDRNPSNANFGAVNIVDNASGTLSEMITQVISGLGLPFDADIASNILAGVYDATSNLTTNATSDTFLCVGYAMQAGGKLQGTEVSHPVVQQPQAASATPVASEPATQVEPTPAPTLTQTPPPMTPAQEYAQNFPPLNQVFGFPVNNTPPAPQSDNFTVPPVVGEDSAPVQTPPMPSQEERPMGEYAGGSNPEVGSSNPDPDWLTPKVFKGTNLG